MARPGGGVADARARHRATGVPDARRAFPSRDRGVLLFPHASPHLPPPSPPPPVVFRLLVPRRRVSAVLGLDGAVARRLEAETGARVAIEPVDDRAPPPRERVVRITSPEDPSRGASSQACPARVALFKAYALVAAPDASARRSRAPIPPFRLLISDDDAATFLGVDGAALHAVRDRSGAAVRVRDASDPADEKATTENPSPPAPNAPAASRGRVVEIPGSPSLACSAAIREIIPHILAARNRDASARGLLGWGFRGWGSGPPRPLGFVPSGGFSPVPPARRFPFPSLDDSLEPASRRVSVPLPRVGAIVGRGGETIQRVRAATGARVKLHDAPAGATKRVLELSGSAAAVAAAGAMVDARLREAEEEEAKAEASKAEAASKVEAKTDEAEAVDEAPRDDRGARSPAGPADVARTETGRRV